MAEDLSIEEQEVCFASRRFRVFCWLADQFNMYRLHGVQLILQV